MAETNSITKARGNARRTHGMSRTPRGALTLIAGEDFPASVAGFIGWYQQSGLQRNR